jgi:CRISPR-associated protein Csb3
MAEASIPVDLFNPGQVFACIGLVEAADVLLGNAEGIFDWSEAGDVRFRIRANGLESPVERVLKFLEKAEARAVALEGSQSLSDWMDAWGPSPKIQDRTLGYPFPDPDSPATLVCILAADGDTILLEHWGDATNRDNVKFWAGSGGYPGAGLARNALNLVRGKITEAFHDPFSLSAPQSSSFRLDWRRDYVPIDTGFSPNSHKGKITMIGFPLVEILAVIGLTNARPKRPNWKNKLDYRYSIVGKAVAGEQAWFPLPILRASLGGAPLPFSMCHFRMSLNEPGQEGQARAITAVTEEPIS